MISSIGLGTQECNLKLLNAVNVLTALTKNKGHPTLRDGWVSRGCCWLVGDDGITSVGDNIQHQAGDMYQCNLKNSSCEQAKCRLASRMGCEKMLLGG